MNKITPIWEVPFGVYVWEMPNGDVVGDEHGNWLSIQAKWGDVKRVAELTDAVRQFGIEEGAPLFLPGRRKIDDEEFERQKARAELGLIPDEYDIAAWLEEEKIREKTKNG